MRVHINHISGQLHAIYVDTCVCGFINLGAVEASLGHRWGIKLLGGTFQIAWICNSVRMLPNLVSKNLQRSISN